jgi:hypothetical protein
MSPDVITPVVIDATSGSQNLPTVVHDLTNGAWQWHLRQTPTSQLPLPIFDGDEGPFVLSDRVEPLRPDVARTVATVLGLWVHYGPNGCRPDLGRHEPGCWHHENKIPTSDSALARLTFGSDGGSQLVTMRKALRAAYGYNTPILVPKAGGGWKEAAYHLLSYDRDVPVGGADAKLLIRLDPFIHDLMMEGKYQSLPQSLVRHLRGSDFLLWEQAIAHPRSAKLRRAGDTDMLSLGGPRSSIPFDRIGLGRTRAHRRPAIIRRGIAEGNDIQDDWGLETDGRDLIVKRLTDRGTVSRGAEPRESWREGPVSHGVEPRESWRGLSTNRAVDRMETGLETGLDSDPPSKKGSDPVADVLRKIFGRELADGTMDKVHGIMRRKRLTDLRAVEVIKAREPGTDPIEWLKAWTAPPGAPRPFKPVSDALIYCECCPDGRHRGIEADPAA